MVLDTDGDDVPVCTSAPPVEALYQRRVVALDPKVGVMLPEPQKVAFEALGAPGIGFTVIVTCNLGSALSQPVELLKDVM